MSQLDLIAELRAEPPVAPAELRERVRRARRGRARAAAALHLAPRARRRDRGGRAGGSGRRARHARRRAAERDAAAEASIAASSPVREPAPGPRRRSPRARLQGGRRLASRTPAPVSAFEFAAVPPPSATNAQRYSATLSLRLKDSAAVSEATNKALRIAAAMGGHPTTVNVDAARKDGEAYLVLEGAAQPRPGGDPEARRARHDRRRERLDPGPAGGHRHDRAHDRPPAGPARRAARRRRRPRTCSRRSTRSPAASRTSSASAPPRSAPRTSRP